MGHLNNALAALLALFSLFAVRGIYTYIEGIRFSRAHGCKPAKRFPQSERIIGYDLYKQQQEAARTKSLLARGLKRYADNGPTFSFSFMGNTFVSTIDPENIKHILATQFGDFVLGSRSVTFGPLLGRGIFTSDGTHWEHSRALVRPNFTRAQVADLNTFETHIQHMIAKIPRDGSTVDLQTLFFRLTLDSATEFLFGESVHSLLHPDNSEEQEFGRAFDAAQNLCGRRGRLGKLGAYYTTKDFQKNCKTVHDFVDKIVMKAVKDVDPQDPEKTASGNGGRYVFLNEMVKSTRDPKQLRDELLNILLAGRDTTASLLSHTFHVLARRPDILKPLQNEIDELNGKVPDYETLKQMKYLKNLLTESLRLFPVVPGNARQANKNTTIPRGGDPDGLSPIFIAKGTIVTYAPYAMHRRKDIYGPDADIFRPERWAPEEGLRPGWGYLPFNGGPRICVGQQFALTEASYTIIRLLQEFKGLENRDDGPWVENLALTLSVDGGVKVAMVPRS
ncbi:cytochrome P450 [Calycina marina]|uniref:Cytochrome P450 n=1 Tax=Calycina marina TaxID=1763456 RepID=A0A9P8CFK8_9HELO|nr:cytochrome P450 [Calycina marina]